MFVAIYDNEIIAYDTNYSSFYAKFKNIEPDILSESYYEKQFKNQNKFFVKGYGKEYLWQKLI